MSAPDIPGFFLKKRFFQISKNKLLNSIFKEWKKRQERLKKEEEERIAQQNKEKAEKLAHLESGVLEFHSFWIIFFVTIFDILYVS